MKSQFTLKPGFYRDLVKSLVGKTPAKLTTAEYVRNSKRSIVSYLTESVKIRCVVDSSDGKQTYRVRLKFQKVEGYPRKGSPMIKVGRVSTYVDLNSLAVHCTCDDFRYRYFDWLKANKHSCGWFRQIVQAASKRPPVAVTEAGCCKHIHAVLEKVDNVVAYRYEAASKAA